MILSAGVGYHGLQEGNGVAVGKPELARSIGSPRRALPPGKDWLAVGEPRVARWRIAAERRGVDAGEVTSAPLLGSYSCLGSRSSVSDTALRRSASLASAA